MKKNIILLLIVALLILPYKVNAACSTEKINDLKKIADNITAVTEYDEKNASVGNYGFNIVTVYGLIDGFYATNKEGTNVFTYSDSDGGTTSETVSYGFGTLYIYSDACPNQALKAIKLDFKKSNIYYDDEECKDIKDEIDVCSKYYNADNLSRDKFIKIVNEYKERVVSEEKEEFDLMSFIKQNIIYIIIGSVVLLAIIILIVVNNMRRNRLD